MIRLAEVKKCTFQQIAGYRMERARRVARAVWPRRDLAPRSAGPTTRGAAQTITLLTLQ